MEPEVLLRSWLQKGYDMIGADGSAEMLEIAMEKKAQSGHDILYLLQENLNFMVQYVLW